MNFDDAGLILVDIQNDFCPGGALAMAEGDQVVPVVNQLIPKFPVVVTTQDWHPPGHCSFALQPPHCVQGTDGAECIQHFSLPASPCAKHSAGIPMPILDSRVRMMSDALCTSFSAA